MMEESLMVTVIDAQLRKLQRCPQTVREHAVNTRKDAVVRPHSAALDPSLHVESSGRCARGHCRED